MIQILIFLSFLTCSIAWGHARLMSPTPRNNNAGIKSGPCGGLARSVSPAAVEGGKMLTIQWEETINHPGRYIFSLSQGNDVGFEQNVLATIVDEQNVGVALPHRYQVQVMIPNMNCPTCTLQMIQSMEENPAAPTYYYSCADLNIRATAAPTPPTTPAPMPTETVQSSTLGTGIKEVEFGKGCGTVKAAAAPEINFKWMIVCLLTMLIPLLAWLKLRAIGIRSNR